MAHHIENLLEREPGLEEGDRRKLRAQLAELRKPIQSDADEKRVVGVLRTLQQVAPRVFDAAMPVIQAIATAYIRQELKLPPTGG